MTLLASFGLKREAQCAMIPLVREDYYELLDMPQTAAKQELRSAYRRLAMRYHPDHSGDDPAAEERFKLIAEAWRVLSDDEKRADYDAWLDLHRRYERLPELAAMPQRHARMSSRQGAERRRERAAQRETRRPGRVRPFLLRRVPRVGYLRYVLMCMCALLAMQPFIRSYSGLGSAPAHAAAAAPKPDLPYGESPLPPEERRKRLQNFVHVLAQAAAEGNAQAQYRYGYLLYHGIDEVVPPNEGEALRWWQRAAAQGNENASLMLKAHAERKSAGQETGAST